MNCLTECFTSLHEALRGLRSFATHTTTSHSRAQLREVIRKFAWNVYAYCLMPNHYHLVLSTERESLSKGMHRLNGLYAQRFNRRHGRVGHLFQNRFSAYVIESDAHLLSAILYVGDNPVRAGLAERPADWPWMDIAHW